MRGNRQTQAGNYLKSATTAAILAFFCQVLVAPTNARASEDTAGDPSDEELIQAFESGFEQEEVDADEHKLVVQRFGPTFVFSAEGGGAKTLELTCVLCSQGEALAKARSFGAAIATSNPEVVSSVETSSEPPAESVDLVAYKKPTTSKKIRPAVMLIGLGLSAVALGGIFVWLDGQCATSACSQDHATKGMGLGVLGAGAVIDVGALVWLFWPERNDGGSK